MDFAFKMWSERKQLSKEVKMKDVAKFERTTTTTNWGGKIGRGKCKLLFIQCSFEFPEGRRKYAELAQWKSFSLIIQLCFPG